MGGGFRDLGVWTVLCGADWVVVRSTCCVIALNSEEIGSMAVRWSCCV